MERDELASWLRLTLTPGIGNGTARKLLATFGLPEAIFSQSPSALLQVVTPAQADALREEPPELPAQLEATWQWLQNPEGNAPRRVLALGDADYPPALLHIEDPPLLLYLMGRLKLPLDPARSIAIVGSRNPTPQGALNARQFAQSLNQAGLTIVSGLALGVDGAAHEGALAGAEASRLATVAVVGTGLDRVYPKRHHQLAHDIAQRGLIVSEYPLGTPPLAANFPRRNRLIAGLSCSTLVVEAALQSGSLITARLAAEQGKDVFAIPGSIHATQSHGCHALIRQGAKLVESAQDVLEDLPGAPLVAAVPTPDRSSPDDEDSLLQALGFDPVNLDALQARTGWPTPQLQARLMTLELDGQVARLPGGLFQRIATT
ncbi:MAG: DNA protecting protein DprA [Curvibacter sp. GWA2_64_110]|nr:MAG: DNA protecting protein DprA [Curvibacter sp. GWA2_64_110]HCY16065.1 DNA-protecting protein DprA [Curvibacter sp.]